MSYRKICAFCGKEFQAKNLQVNFCSEDCQKKHRNQKKRQWVRNSKISFDDIGKIIDEKIKNSGINNISLNQKFDKLKEKCISIDNAVYNLAQEVEKIKKALSDLANSDEVKNNQEKPVKQDKKPDTILETDATPKPQKPEKTGQPVILECERMKARGTSLPCGKRYQCWKPDKCDKNPLKTMPDDID